MKHDNKFLVKSEGDCERVCKVFIQWLHENSPQLKEKQIIVAPKANWASLFTDIYEDEILNNGLDSQAKENVIQVEFNIADTKRDTYDAEDLLSMLQDLLNSFDYVITFGNRTNIQNLRLFISFQSCNICSLLRSLHFGITPVVADCRSFWFSGLDWWMDGELELAWRPRSASSTRRSFCLRRTCRTWLHQ